MSVTQKDTIDLKSVIKIDKLVLGQIRGISNPRSDLTAWSKQGYPENRSKIEKSAAK